MEKLTFYGPGTLRVAHVDFEHNAAAFFTSWLPDLIP